MTITVDKKLAWIVGMILILGVVGLMMFRSKAHAEILTGR